MINLKCMTILEMVGLVNGEEATVLNQWTEFEYVR